MPKRRLKFGKGRSSIELDDTVKELIEKALREAAPATMDILEKELDDRVKYAKKNWIVRHNQVIKKEDGSFVTIKRKSKRSVDKFTQGIRLLNGGKTIEGFFTNTAGYAYVIRAATTFISKDSSGNETTLKQGANVADEAMIKPAMEASDELVSKLAEAYMLQQNKVK